MIIHDWKSAKRVAKYIRGPNTVSVPVDVAAAPKAGADPKLGGLPNPPAPCLGEAAAAAPKAAAPPKAG